MFLGILAREQDDGKTPEGLVKFVWKTIVEHSYWKYFLSKRFELGGHSEHLHSGHLCLNCGQHWICL